MVGDSNDTRDDGVIVPVVGFHHNEKDFLKVSSLSPLSMSTVGTTIDAATTLQLETSDFHHISTKVENAGEGMVIEGQNEGENPKQIDDVHLLQTEVDDVDDDNNKATTVNESIVTAVTETFISPSPSIDTLSSSSDEVIITTTKVTTTQEEFKEEMGGNNGNSKDNENNDDHRHHHDLSQLLIMSPSPPLAALQLRNNDNNDTSNMAMNFSQRLTHKEKGPHVIDGDPVCGESNQSQTTNTKKTTTTIITNTKTTAIDNKATLRSLGILMKKVKNHRRDKKLAIEAMEQLVIHLTKTKMTEQRQYLGSLAVPHIIDFIESNIHDGDCVEIGINFLYKSVMSDNIDDQTDDTAATGIDINNSLFVSSISLAHRTGGIGWLLRVMKQRMYQPDKNFQSWTILGKIAESSCCLIDEEELFEQNLADMYFTTLNPNSWDFVSNYAMYKLLFRSDILKFQKQFFGKEGVLNYVFNNNDGDKSYIPIFVFFRGLIKDEDSKQAFFPDTDAASNGFENDVDDDDASTFTHIGNNDDDQKLLIDWIVSATVEIMRHKANSAKCQHDGMEILESLLSCARSCCIDSEGSSDFPVVQTPQGTQQQSRTKIVRRAMLKAKAMRVLGNIFDTYDGENDNLNERAHKLIKPLL